MKRAAILFSFFALLAIAGPARSFDSSVQAVQMPALTGDCTSTIGTVATTCTKTNNVSFATSATTDTTNAANISSGNLPIGRLLANTNPAEGCEATPNLQLNASVGSNLLTIAVKGNNGSDPSASNPVLLCFRDSTVANGGPVWLSLQAALSINTNTVGATLGTANSVPFRIWVVAFNNGGTAVLALWQSVTGGASPTAINQFNPAAVASSTAISGTATAAGTFYTPNGTTVTSKSFRILGYVDYASGLATAGTYASAPTTVQLMSPGVRLPGQTVQTVTASTNTITNNSTSTYSTTNLSLSITPTAAPNLVRVMAYGAGRTDAGAAAIISKLHRGSTAIGNEGEGFSAGGASWSTHVNFALDAPGVTTATTYAVKIKDTDNATQVSYPKGNAADTAIIIADEIMT